MSGRHEHGTTQLSIPRMARGFSLAMSRQCTRFTEGGLCNAHRQCGIKQQAFMFAGNWSRRVVLAVGLFYGLVGFSMGGGIALSLIDLAPGRAALRQRAPLSVERTG